MFCIPDGDDGVNLFNQLLLLIVLKVHVPLGEARLAGAILNQDKANLHNTEEIGCVTRKEFSTSPDYHLYVQYIEKASCCYNRQVLKIFIFLSYEN